MQVGINVTSIQHASSVTSTSAWVLSTSTSYEYLQSLYVQVRVQTSILKF